MTTLHYYHLDGSVLPLTPLSALSGQEGMTLIAGQPIVLRDDLLRQRRYVAIDLICHSDHQCQLECAMMATAESEPRCLFTAGMIPGAVVRLVIDLRQCHGQQRDLDRTPGRLRLRCSGRRLVAAADLDHIVISLKDTERYQNCLLAAAQLHQQMPICPIELKHHTALVDELGQRMAHPWQGYCDAAAMVDRLYQARKEPVPSWPQGWSRYGGMRHQLHVGSQHFRLHRDDDRYWLIDPEGHPFFIAGIDGAADSRSAAVVPDTEACFAALPGSGYDDCRSEDARRSLPTVAFERANLRRAFGNDWRQHWLQLTANRLRSWRFNTLGAASDSGLIRDGQFPYLIELIPPRTSRLLYRDFPDVFDQRFVDQTYHMAKKLLGHRNNSHAVGYYFAAASWTTDPVELASEILEAETGSATRKHFRQWLEQRYQHHLETWWQAWHISQPEANELGLSDFSSIETTPLHRLIDRCRGCAIDLDSYSALLIRRYYDILSQACKQAAPELLHFGQPLIADYRPPMIWLSIIAESCDIISLDLRLPDSGVLDLLDQVHRLADAPIFIHSFVCGAGDRGCLANGHCAVASQDDRADVYRALVQQAAVHPAIIGMQYGQMLDDPCLGDPVGNCSQVGLVDVCHQPYDGLVNQISDINSSIYRWRTGSLPVSDTAIDLQQASGF